MSRDEGDHDAAAERAGDLPDGMHGELLGDLLDEATSSLRDDAELRLDVRAELASHLEEKRDDFIARGHSAEEALDLARQSFGSPDTLARDLLAANRRRMKLRALARLVFRTVALPAVALAVLSISVHRAVFLALPLGISSTDYGRAPSVVTTDSWDVLAESDDMPTPEPMHWAGEGQWYTGLRAAWEADITNAPLAARYLRAFAWHILSEACDVNGLVGRIAARGRFPRDFEKRKRALAGMLVAFERDIRQAQRIDSENAYWRYLLAGVLARASVRYGSAHGGGAPDYGGHVVLVLDRPMFGRAIDEYLAADSMARVSDLRVELTRVRTEGLPPVRSAATAFRRVRISADHPPMVLAPSMLSVMPRGARMLAEEGDRGKGLRLLDSWERLVRREVEYTWDPAWTAHALNRKVFEGLAAAYAELRSPGRAEDMRKRARLLADAVRSWREDPASGRDLTEIATRGGLSAMFGSFWPTAGELGTGRRLDQVLIESAGLGVLTVYLFALMSICGIVSLRWMLDRRADSAPVAVMPTPRALAEIIGGGLVAPLTVYWAYTRLSGIAGREYSIWYMGHRFVLEAALLVVTVTALLVALSLRHARRRCADLGMPVAPRVPRWQRATGLSLLATAWLACLFTGRGWGQWYAAGLVAAFMLFTIIGVVVSLYALAVRRPAHARFKATAARMLVVPLALAILVLTLTVRPYLAARETTFVMSDPALQMDDELMLPRSQAAIVRGFKEVVLSALDADADREMPPQ
ncbi:MAG: permease prefix domain 1-containing protein [Planctomycetota bacterium]|jgi:hypothetical protein